MYSYLRVPTCTVPVHVPTCTVCRSVGVVCWKLFCSKNTSENFYEKCTVHTSLIMTQQKQQNKKPAKWNLCRLFVYTGRIVLCTMAVK